ncbi:MAG: HAD-IA family hydrolase [Gammaproteobacteria bacterium]
MSFRAVLWDFGGVLTSSPFDAFNKYELERNIPKDFIRGVNAVNPHDNAWAKFESSRISAAEFNEAFLAETSAAGHPIPGADVIPLLGGAVRPNMVAVLKRCKADYQVACLTNNADAGSGPGMAATDERAAEVREVMNLFDLVIESSKEGIRKPDPRIYALACERMNLSAEEIVYLDDLGINLKPAKAIGMTTIKVLSEQQAIEDLAATLKIDFQAMLQNR